MRARAVVTMLLACLIVTSGCARFFQQGSVYRETGRAADLLAEPTFDVGFGFDQFPGMHGEMRVRFHDADGHGSFDTAVAASEVALFLPAVAGSLVHGAVAQVYRGGDALLARAGLADPPRAVSVAAHLPLLGVQYVFSKAPFYAGCAMLGVYDPIVHDLPVILGSAARRVPRNHP